MAYNPYSDIQTVYNAKVAWNKATTDEERKKQSDIANNARKTLETYGYGDVANQISALGADATAARKIMEKYAPVQTPLATKAPDSTNLSNTELITTNNNEVRNKTNQLWGTQTGDRQTMANKYDRLEETAYSNPFTTDEAKAILAKYDLSGLQARDNAVASGSASNGGNIDSYAAANALRQQASLVNQGQMAVLEAHNNKINNVKGILESLGVYLQDQDKGMQNTITSQANEGQRLFENEETAKNNEVARLSEQASVTGYVPNEWVIENDDVYNTYLNADGTFKKEMENVDIQALINSAKASGDTDTAKKLAVVRARKILGNYDVYGKYGNAGDISYMSPQITEARRESEQNADVALKTLKSETDLANAEIAANKYISDSTNATNKAIADNSNATELAVAQLKGSTSSLDLSDIERMLKNTTTPSQELIDAYNAVSGDATTYTVDNPPPITGVNVDEDKKISNKPTGDDDWETFTGYFSNDKIKNFLNEKLKPYVDNGWEINEDVLEKLIVGTDVKNSNSTTYDIDVEDAKAICNALGLDTAWVDKYKNRWGFNAGKGMKSAK